jgi:CRP/FNR family transcriptional regulator
MYRETQTHTVRNEINRDHSSLINGETPSLDKINYFEFPVFKVLKANELHDFNRFVLIKKYRKKEFIYLPYDKSEFVYFIKRGNIEIGYLDHEGKELTLDILGTGEIFGPALGLGFTNGFARALEDSSVCIMKKTEFDYYLQKYSRLTFRLLSLLTQKIKTIENKLQNLVFKDVKTRICEQLFRLYKKSGDEKSGRIKIPLTHQDVAKLVGSTRETASVCLAELKREGIISYRRQKISIDSVKKLLNHFN